MNKASLPPSDPCSCVRRYCPCTCAYFHGLRGEKKSKVQRELILIDIELQLLFQAKLLTTAELIGLVPTIVVVIAGVLQWDAAAVTAFVLFVFARAVCGVQALVQGNTGTLKTGWTL